MRATRLSGIGVSISETVASPHISMSGERIESQLCVAICLSFPTPGLMGTARIEGSLGGKRGWGRETLVRLSIIQVLEGECVVCKS